MFITDLLQIHAIKKHGSKLSTRMIPLKNIHTVHMLLDAEGEGCKAAMKAANEYFNALGVKTEFLLLNKDIMMIDFNFFGKLRRKKNEQLQKVKADLFISLLNDDSFQTRYMAACSRAGFKIGRMQVKGDVFDIVFTDPEKEQAVPSSQHEALQTILAFIEKVK